LALDIPISKDKYTIFFISEFQFYVFNYILGLLFFQEVNIFQDIYFFNK